MTLANALAKTPRLVSEVEAALHMAAQFQKCKDVTFNTLAALADLRSLTMFAELSFPEPISRSFRSLADRAGFAPFTPVAA